MNQEAVETKQQEEPGMVALNGGLIRRLRDKSGLSRHRFCFEVFRQTGVEMHPMALRRIELGETRKPGPDVHYAMAFTLGVTMEDLLTGDLMGASQG